MKIREENCNMFLLAVVTVFTVVIAASSSLVTAVRQGPGPARRASRAEQAAADKPIVYVTDQPAVRVVGAPFVPNTNPRER